MTEQSIRNGALLKSGTLSPNPWDLALSGQNGWFYTGRTRTADKAPQGCDLSANSSAGMATGGFDAEVALNSNSDPSNISLLRAKNGLDNGVHFIQGCPNRSAWSDDEKQDSEVSAHLRRHESGAGHGDFRD
jgi:hypothetical protein